MQQVLDQRSTEGWFILYNHDYHLPSYNCNTRVIVMQKDYRILLSRISWVSNTSLSTIVVTIV